MCPTSHQVTDPKALVDKVQEFLDDYNLQFPTQMHLVFFKVTLLTLPTLLILLTLLTHHSTDFSNHIYKHRTLSHTSPALRAFFANPAAMPCWWVWEGRVGSPLHV
jgi:hypothetical protein